MWVTPCGMDQHDAFESTGPGSMSSCCTSCAGVLCRANLRGRSILAVCRASRMSFVVSMLYVTSLSCLIGITIGWGAAQYLANLARMDPRSLSQLDSKTFKAGLVWLGRQMPKAEHLIARTHGCILSVWGPWAALHSTHNYCRWKLSRPVSIGKSSFRRG